jgi:hypothetical protein
VDLRQIATQAPIVRSVTTAVSARAALLLVASLSVSLAGCSSAKQPPTPAPSTPAATAPDAAAQLAAVATVAKSASYDASYAAHSDAKGAQPARTSTIEVYHTASATRLDVDEQTTHVLIQVDAAGTASCTVSAGSANACVLLAGPDASIPANIPDPGLQHTFTSTLDVMASGTGLTVAAAAPIAATNGVPAANCFALIAAPSPTAPAGTYCFSAGGIVVRAQFRSSLLQLTSIGAQPASSNFSLPASPVPVPVAASSGPGSPASSSP